MAGRINPRDLLEMARALMSNYRLPHGASSIDSEDTGAMVAIIIYFIARDSKISMSKIEYYFIILDCEIYKQFGSHLFHWTLRNSYQIRDFRKVIDFMIFQGLILRKGKSIRISTSSEEIIKNLRKMLQGILPVLEKIISEYRSNTAIDMQKLLSVSGCDSFTQSSKPAPKTPKGAVPQTHLTATLHKVIDSHTSQHNAMKAMKISPSKEKNVYSSSNTDVDEVDASTLKALNDAIDSHER